MIQHDIFSCPLFRHTWCDALGIAILETSLLDALNSITKNSHLGMVSIHKNGSRRLGMVNMAIIWGFIPRIRTVLFTWSIFGTPQPKIKTIVCWSFFSHCPSKNKKAKTSKRSKTGESPQPVSHQHIAPSHPFFGDVLRDRHWASPLSSTPMRFAATWKPPWKSCRSCAEKTCLWDA